MITRASEELTPFLQADQPITMLSDELSANDTSGTDNDFVDSPTPTPPGLLAPPPGAALMAMSLTGGLRRWVAE